MNKNKIIICTILFSIVTTSAWVLTFFIKNEHFTLYEIIAPVMCGAWMSERIKNFHDWLSK